MGQHIYSPSIFCETCGQDTDGVMITESLIMMAMPMTMTKGTWLTLARVMMAMKAMLTMMTMTRETWLTLARAAAAASWALLAAS